MSTILDLVDLSETSRLAGKQENIVSASIFTYEGSYNNLDVYISGIFDYLKIKNAPTMVLFHDDSIPAHIIKKWKLSKKLILCKFTNLGGLFGLLVRYIPLFTDVINFKYASVLDVDRKIHQWKRDLYGFQSTVNSNIETNSYVIPLAGELLSRNLISDQICPVNIWYRISAYPVVVKYGNFLPISLIDNFIFNTVDTPEYQNVVNFILEYEPTKVDSRQGKFIYGCDELMLLSVMKYLEDNKINFTYGINVYTHRSPFYCWLEHIKPSEEKQQEFLKIVGSEDSSVSEFLLKYPNPKRYELYALLRDKFDNDFSFFDDEKIIRCITRFVSYCCQDPKSDNNILYLHKW